MIDLHIHSTESDGQYAPKQLIEKAYQEGITVVSITDHDSISGVKEGRKKAQELGISYINGVEISVFSKEEMHILGYGIDIESQAIRMACQRFLELREERATRIIEYLKQNKINITLPEVKSIAGSKLIARPHFARLLLEKGYVNNIREAFDRYLATPEFHKTERPKPSAQEGIKIIHDSGGVAVLAHPVTLKLQGMLLERQVLQLIQQGLDGIETYYSKHTSKQTQEYHALAEKYNLLETCGSDFHGEKVKPDILLGRKILGGPLVSDDTQRKIEKSMTRFIS